MSAKSPDLRTAAPLESSRLTRRTFLRACCNRRAGKLFIRQIPGPKNSLGLVKFVFPNSYSVYMHDTPATEVFAKSRRDFSHGCIRLEKPAELAA